VSDAVMMSQVPGQVAERLKAHAWSTRLESNRIPY
jgi:hypothetical protein